MAMIVTVQDDEDPYGRTGRGTQREDGSWCVEYFKPGGLPSTLAEHGDLIGFQILPAEDDVVPDESDVARFMCETLADRVDAFGGIFPDAGYQRNRSHVVATAGRCLDGRASHDPRNVFDDETGAYLGDECGDCGRWLSEEPHHVQ